MSRIVAYAIVFCILTSVAQTAEVTIAAIDDDMISPLNDSNLPGNNRLPALIQPTPMGTIQYDGIVKFDLSAVPDDATITAMTLRTFHESLFGSPFDNPRVQIFRSSGDSWSNDNQTDLHPGLQEPLTDIHISFPLADRAPYDWSLDVEAADWSADLLDDTLTLVMSNVNTSYSYVNWYGSNPSGAPPTLTVEFRTVPEPATLILAIVAICSVAAKWLLIQRTSHAAEPLGHSLLALPAWQIANQRRQAATSIGSRASRKWPPAVDWRFVFLSSPPHVAHVGPCGGLRVRLARTTPILRRGRGPPGGCKRRSWRRGARPTAGRRFALRPRRPAAPTPCGTRCG